MPLAATDRVYPANELFAEAYANRLTSSTFDPVSKTPGFKKSAARIERLH